MALDPHAYELVVIDFQEKLFGAMPEPQRFRAQRAADNLVYIARELGIPTTFTEQYPQGLGPTISSLGATDPFVKTAFAATDEAGFLGRLSGRTPILLGMETHICVAHTAAGLLAGGHGTAGGANVVVVPDACVSRRDEDWHSGIAWMRQLGAQILPSETVLFGLLGRASGPLFKEISRRIR